MNIKNAIQNRGVRNRIKRYVLISLGWLAAVILLMWAILWIYVMKNEDALKQRVSNAIHQKTRGDVKIGGLSVSFFRTFPLLSLQLNDVVLLDSVMAFKHKEFLKASDIYLRINIAGLITNRSPIGKILVRNGELNVSSDSLGNSNEYIFKTKPSTESSDRAMGNIPVLELQNISASYVDPERNKDYSAIINSLKCSAKDQNGTLHIKLSLRLLAKNLSFNTIRGAYMKEKMIEGKIRGIYNMKSKDLVFDNMKLYLDKHPFHIVAKFNLDKSKADFYMNFSTNGIMFTKAASLLSEPIEKALEPYSVTNPVNLKVNLSGKTLYKFIPLVTVNMDVSDNKIITPQGIFEDCSFKGFFSNEFEKGKERDDANSYLVFEKFSGRWENIVFHSDSIKISNLKKPYLDCDVAANVDMKTLNKLVDSKTFRFLEGNTSFDLDFNGPVYGNDSIASNINGYINIEKASIKYIPRNLLLSECEANLKFINNDLNVSKLNTVIGKTKLFMNGSAINFLTLLNVSPEKLVLKWKINSPELHLEDFKPLLSSPEKEPGTKPGKSTIAKTSSKIDKMFSEGEMYISLETPLMEYKTFRATGVKTDVVFTPTEISLQQISLSHAQGKLNARGMMKNGIAKNAVKLFVQMYRMDVPQLFTAFNNFGQDAITSKNLKGKLSADIKFTTSITNKAALVKDDSEGTVEFLLEEGELNNFEPMMEISKKAFKKQNFNQIKFADLKNRLDIKGTTFIVNSMDIRSTALNFSVEGVYDIRKGTDMSIKLPLRNLVKSQANTDISDEGKPARGVSLRLRAKTGDDGKLKVSWDPLRLAARNKKDVKDSAEVKN